MENPSHQLQINSEQFQQDCEQLVKVSNDLGDSWSLCRQGNDVWLENIVFKCFNEGEPTSRTVQSTYEIHYNLSYGVPVLYCRFSSMSGELLDHDTVKDLILGDNVTSEMVSMAPHPRTGFPWYQIHPCRTASTSAEIRQNVDSEGVMCDYLTTFLSLYGQAVGLTLSPLYAIPR